MGGVFASLGDVAPGDRGLGERVHKGLTGVAGTALATRGARLDAVATAEQSAVAHRTRRALRAEQVELAFE